MSEKILSIQFVDKYKKSKTPFDGYGLGEFIYKRTYSRTDEHGKQEEWYETIQRVINGVYNIKRQHYNENNIQFNIHKERNEAEQMYDLLFNIKFLPGGRSLWAMGTKITDQKSLFAALNNCAAVTTEDIEQTLTESFEFLFDASMLGIGIGFDTKGQNKLLIHKPLKTTETYTIEDSREGWVNGLKKLLNQYFKSNQNKIIIDYSKIRPAGKLLSTFGGTSSGPEPLKKSFILIEKILDKRIGHKLTSRDIVDIMNIICLCVVSGNVRRSASVAFGEFDDTEFIELKNYEKNPERSQYGWLSNNSIQAKKGMNYTKIAQSVALNGEPGLMWIDNMKKYSRMNGIKDNKDKNVCLSNPCLEVSLESNELCNLVEIFINRHNTYEEFQNTLYYAYKYAKMVSLCKTHWEKTNKVIEKNRRIGCSLTGIANFISDKGIHQLKKWTKQGYKYIQDLDIKTSKEFKINESIKLTCIKPSGSISLLVPYTSPGIHYPQSKYYIRRVRINENSKILLESMKKNGYKIEKSVTEPYTFIVSFPINSKCNRSIKDLTLWEQLEMVAKLQEWWADNQVSCTISFSKEEKKDISNALNLYQYKLKGVSFLPKFDTKEYYPQAPYEEISKEYYKDLKRYITNNNNNIEIDKNEQEEEMFCTTDACYVRDYMSHQSKNIVLMNGVTGSGKSYLSKKLCNYLNDKNIKTVVISKDDYRYTQDGYVFNPEYETIVHKKYFNRLSELLKSNEYQYIILDNTHIGIKFTRFTLDYISSYKVKYLMISIAPYDNLQTHVEQNIHNITLADIKRQFKDWMDNDKQTYNKIKYTHQSDKIHFTTDEMYKIINDCVDFFR